MNTMMPGQDEVQSGFVQNDFFRVLGAMIGCALIGFGLYWSVKLFFLIGKVLRDPKQAMPVVKAWESFFNAEKLSISVGQIGVSIDSQFMTILILGIGVFFLICITLNIMKIGADLLSSAVTDAKAMRKILYSWASAFIYRQPGQTQPTEKSS